MDLTERAFITAEDMDMAYGASFVLNLFGQRSMWKWRLVAHVSSPAGSYTIASSAVMYRHAATIDELWSSDLTEGRNALQELDDDLTNNGFRMTEQGYPWYVRVYKRPFDPSRVPASISESSRSNARPQPAKGRTLPPRPARRRSATIPVLVAALFVLSVVAVVAVVAVRSQEDGRDRATDDAHPLGYVATVPTATVTVDNFVGDSAHVRLCTTSPMVVSTLTWHIKYADGTSGKPVASAGSPQYPHTATSLATGECAAGWIAFTDGTPDMVVYDPDNASPISWRTS